MDARREREERDRQEQRGEDDAADVIALARPPRARGARSATKSRVPTCCQVSDTPPRTRPTTVSSPRWSVSPSPVHGFRHRLNALIEKPVYVFAASHSLPTRLVDGSAGGKEPEAALHVGAGRDGRPQPHLEREEHDREGRHPRCQGCQDPNPAALTVTLRVAGAPEEVPLDPDDGDDRNQERELELHEQRDDRADRGRFGPAAPQEVDRCEQDERADRVDLAPDGRVEDGAGVEEVDRRHGERGSVRADPEARAIDQLTAPAPNDDEQEPRDGDVRQDPGNLHQPAGHVDPDDRSQRRPDLAEHPQDVEVAGRIIGEVVGRVELGWSDAC